MFDLFRRFSSKEIKSSAEVQAKAFADSIREAAKRGDRKALNDLAENALVPKDAVSLNGHYYEEIKLTLRTFADAEETEESIGAFTNKINKLFDLMRDFYRDGAMATWIFHQVCLEIDISEKFEECLIGDALMQMRDAKKKAWYNLGYKKFVIEWVETKYGPMSCSKERFWESWEKDAIERLYKASLDELPRSELIAYVNNLSCIDHSSDIRFSQNKDQTRTTFTEDVNL